MTPTVDDIWNEWLRDRAAFDREMDERRTAGDETRYANEDGRDHFLSFLDDHPDVQFYPELREPLKALYFGKPA